MPTPKRTDRKEPKEMTPSSKQKRIYELEIENWNLKHPVGTAVNLKKDDGTVQVTRTRSEAYLCDSGFPVAFFENVSGYYLLSRAKAIQS